MYSSASACGPLYDAAVAADYTPSSADPFLGSAGASGALAPRNGCNTLASSNPLLNAAKASAAAGAAHRMLTMQYGANYGSYSHLTGMDGMMMAAPAPQAAGSASLYVKNLPAESDKLYMYERFAPFGAILSVKLLMEPLTAKCRGVGFVNYAEHFSAVHAVQALHGTKVADKLLHVSLQSPRARCSVEG